MDPLTIGILGIVVLILLILTGMPVGAALFSAGAGGLALLFGPQKAAVILFGMPFEIASNYSLVVVPMFILMGLVAADAGLMRDMFDAAHRWLAGLRGSLLISTVASSAGFAAVSGSTIVNSAVFTRIAYPEMTRLGYDKGLAGGVIAASGTLAAFIPPSITFVLYALLTQQSIGKMLLAGIVPGILTAVAYVVAILLIARLKPSWIPQHTQSFTWGEKLRSLRPVWAVLLLSFIVVGGIYTGTVPPSAAGSVGAIGAIVIVLAMRRLSLHGVWLAVRRTVQISAVLAIIVIGGLTFSRFLVFSGFVRGAINAITDMGLGEAGFLAALVVLFLILGMFLDSLAILVMAAAILYPVAAKMGFDQIWFAVIVVKLMEIGVITPPVGINLFAVVSASDNDLKLTTLYRGIAPLLLAELVVLLILINFPILSTWIPSAMAG
jgi:tripartite ATP-independent transporter DctM subunit